MDTPMESAWRAQQEAAARFAEGWRALLESTAGRTTGPGHLRVYRTRCRL